MGLEDDWKALDLLFGTHQGSFTSPAPVVFPGKISALLWNERTHQVAVPSTQKWQFLFFFLAEWTLLARWSDTLTCLLLSPPLTWLADTHYLPALCFHYLCSLFLQCPGWLTCTCSSSRSWRIPFSEVHSATVKLEKQDWGAQLMMDPDQWFV